MNGHDKKWNMNYEKLVKFKRTNGHCMVPYRYEQAKSLGKWVSNQRSGNNNNKIRLDRKELLDEIGFAWKSDGANNYDDDKLWHQQSEKLWRQQYERLLEYKRKNGHCKVPKRYEQSESLGQWVKNQRAGHANNKILPEQKKILDGIGFAWKADVAQKAFKPDDKLWHQQYEKLVEFKRNTGHCMVPYKYERDKSVGEWVRTQRKLHNKNKLRPDREKLLNEIGFAWKHCSLAAPSSTIDVTGLGIGKATGICSSMEEDGGGHDEGDSNPSLVTGSALIGSDPDQEVVQEEATAPCEIPYGWTPVKLEPDC
jgi:hypothetical protein